ncbi:hypothetical protein HYPSUDRAFT_207990 [Hypholoma sublateritium FD-334 SS-4]|uniref:Uncharacterized protein n=1 Tax=Hypholoma sublateritium (strain FD-334 SS-4) TaxID=945553 RepID=A0A0D2N8C0_HYPSF|nr:hypothetical protein HYPSUDRAFT_207990 [Hypholoma sublateritium FD-334 SS-4]
MNYLERQRTPPLSGIPIVLAQAADISLYLLAISSAAYARRVSREDRTASRILLPTPHTLPGATRAPLEVDADAPAPSCSPSRPQCHLDVPTESMSAGGPLRPRSAAALWADHMVP